MSISTRSCCSYPSCPSGSDVKQGSNAVRAGWESELKGCLIQFPGIATNFIDELLPCSTPFPELPEDASEEAKAEEQRKLDEIFSAYKPGPGQEKREYDHLIEALNTLVETFEPDRKLTIVDSHGTKFFFPVARFEKNHHETYPDITVSFPGQALNSAATWRDVSMVMEVKGDETQDPFARDGDKHRRTVEQLAKNARNLLLAHGFLSAFVVGIYGNTVRLARFDHASAVVAPPISLAAGQGGVKILKKFLWHFAHPLVGSTVVGADPTVMKLSADDQEWVKSQLEQSQTKDWDKYLGALDEGRRMEVYDQKTGKCVPYLAYYVVDVNGRLFSRATTVWRAIKDTRVQKDGRLIPNPTCTTKVKPCIVKESWRQLVRTAETEFYARLDAKIPKERRFGIATMECGGDIGAFEYRWWEATKKRRESRDAAVDEDGIQTNTETSESSTEDQYRDYPRFSSTGSIGSYTAPSGNRPTARLLPEDDYPLQYPQHQTYSRRLQGDMHWHRERSHMRMVIKDVGRPLTEFTSTQELVMAIRDAIKGHHQAWEEAGLLHRDISLGNILILDEKVDGHHVGFIHDLDYSSMKPDGFDEDPPKEDDSDGKGNANFKERTGTYFFMSLELIKPMPAALHHPHHDLESYYWVLLWVVLRHTECSLVSRGTPGERVCADIFKCDVGNTGYALRQAWAIDEEWLNVKGNVPLKTLVTKFSELVRRQVVANVLKTSQVLFTYTAILEIFDEALAMEGWPEQDRKACKLIDDPDPRTVAASILCDLPPGYRQDQSEHRVLRSALASANAAASLAASIGSRGYQYPATPSQSGSQAASASGSKRRLEETQLAESAEEASRLPKRSKSTMPPPASSAAAGTGSRGRRSGGVRRQPSTGTRASSRIAAQKAASGSGPST